MERANVKGIMVYLGAVSKSLGKVTFELQEEDVSEDETILANKSVKSPRKSFKKKMAEYGPGHPEKARLYQFLFTNLSLMIQNLDGIKPI